MKITPTLAGAISGSMGGITGSHNKGGTYLRRRSVPSDPGTGAQTVVRDAVAVLSQRWSSTLTATQRAGWDTYAANVAWIDSLGQSIQLSGINHYVRANVPRVQANTNGIEVLAIIDDAPTTFQLGVAPNLYGTTTVHSAGPPEVISLGLAWDNDAAFTSDDKILFFVGPPQNAGVKFFKGPYFLFSSEDGDAGNNDVGIYNSTSTVPYAARYGDAVTGQNLFGYVRSTMADGRLSSRIRFGPIPIVAAS